MKLKSAAGFYSSSLEMLLDTMCNMLGGVVFIALMVAVVAQDSTTHTPDQYHGQAAALSNELASLTASNNVVESELRAILLRLQDPRQRPQTNVMRLPNLANTTRQPWLVIMQYGKLYPLDVFSFGSPVVPILNNREVLYQRQSGYVEARPGLGEDPESGIKEMAQAFKDTGQTNYYLAFWVYDDSFPAFMRARETATKLALQFGWNPLPANQRLQVGRNGERVLPQN
jgi:hypothetical protein